MTLGEVKDVRTIARKITNVENGIKIDQDNFNKKFRYSALPAQAVQANHP